MILGLFALIAFILAAAGLYSTIGLPENWRLETSQGLGLANTVARLRQLFGTDFELVIQNRAQGGVEARVSIPLRTTAAFAVQW